MRAKKLVSPGPRTKEILDKIAKYEAPSSGAPSEKESEWPMVWAEGEGAEIRDLEGNEYIDLTAGFSAANTGYSHPKLAEAIYEQAKRLTDSKSRTPTVQRATLLEMLYKITPGKNKKIHFATGGAEANEVALKLVKLYNKKSEVVCFYGSWHGRTHATLAITGSRRAKEGVYPLPAGAVFVPYAYCYRCPLKLKYPECGVACLDLIENAVKDPLSGHADIGAMIVEPIQGMGGHAVPPKKFIQGLRKICDENNLVMIADEIYTGFGRTGKMFAVEHFDVLPDLHVMGKGLTGALPFSAIVGKTAIMDSGQGKLHSMTFQAYPLACAAAIATIEIIQEERLVEGSGRKGAYFMRRLMELAERYDLIGEVRGRGLLIGVELVESRRTKAPADKKTRQILLFAARNGVIVDVGARTNVLRITPPLVISMDQIDRVVDALEAGFKSLKN